MSHKASYVAKALFDRGDFVRVVDVNPSSAFTEPICTELLIGDLGDLAFCNRAVRGVDTVLHFATPLRSIHDNDDLIEYRNDITATVNLLSASREEGVRLFLHASSTSEHSISSIGYLRDKKDVFDSVDAPLPEDLHGLEKPVSELLRSHGTGKLQVCIARFHGIYGPHGGCKESYENAPAALLRRALAAKASPEPTPTLEIYGDEEQRQNLLYIDDCVDAVLLLLNSPRRELVEIGSDQFVTMHHLAELACKCAGLRPENVRFEYIHGSEPLGSPVQCLKNGKLKGQMGWSPKVTLEDGMARTCRWIKKAVHRRASPLTEERADESRIPQPLTFAVILPVSSQGYNDPTECISTLSTFADSLESTTWNDMNGIGHPSLDIKVYLAVNDDDSFLSRDSEIDAAEAAFMSKNIMVEVCSHSHGHICAIWRECARRAWEDGCDYIALLDSDVVLRNQNWMRDIHGEFLSMESRLRVPRGFGCVAFTDEASPGMPTFPVIHSTHMDIFAGEIVPDNFMDQPAGHYLFQLYRRWNCSVMSPCRISGGKGALTRPAEQRTDSWSFEPLNRAVEVTQKWHLDQLTDVQRCLTLDVVIPCYRVQIPFLDRMLALQPSPLCSVMFHIIIDDPHSTAICDVQRKYAHRNDVHIRINHKNLGPSGARNRGMNESAAEWVIFLDDDVIPNPMLLQEAEMVIHAHPDAAGFVGSTRLPPANTVFTTAIHLAGLVEFWDVAEKMPEEKDLSWGPTANLITRRIQDDVAFEDVFITFGGGEDIDFVLRRRNYWVSQGGQGFHSAPGVLCSHNWWYDGKRSYYRFYRWARGDSLLIKLHPELTYLDHAPNGAELLLFAILLAVAGTLVWISSGKNLLLVAGIHLIGATLAGHILSDMVEHYLRGDASAAKVNSTLTGTRWALAGVEATVLRFVCETARVITHIRRKEFEVIGRRFEIYAFRMGKGRMDEERRKSRQRFLTVISMAVMSLAIMY